MERVVLITGAGTGIGLASALEAARLGFYVVAAVHHESEEDGVRKAVADAHLPAGAVEVEALDVRDEARARAVITASEPWGLVNNAAVVNAGLLVDVPVEDANPIASFYGRVARRTRDGMLFTPEQRLTREEALKSYTLNNAYAAFEENVKGSLTPGKLADLVVLSKDIMRIPEEEIPTAQVDLTIVGGEIRYRRAAQTAGVGN